MLLISYLLKRKKKKNFLLNFAIHRRNEGVVTYGIRAGSTRDLGFATAFVDMNVYLTCAGYLRVFILPVHALCELSLEVCVFICLCMRLFFI
jgi:hypothetical protein